MAYDITTWNYRWFSDGTYAEVSENVDWTWREK